MWPHLLQDLCAGFIPGLQEIPFFAHFHPIWGLNFPLITLATKPQCHDSYLLQGCSCEMGQILHTMSLKDFSVAFCSFLQIKSLVHHPLHNTLLLFRWVQNTSWASPTPGKGLARPSLWHATVSPTFPSNHFQALRKRKEEMMGKEKWKKKLREGWQCYCHPCKDN